MHFSFNNKRKHLDCDKVNTGAHDKGSWWIIRLLCLSLLVIRCFISRRSKRFQSSYCVKVGATKETKWKKGEGRGKEVTFSPHLLPFHSCPLFCFHPNILDELARERLQRRLIMAIRFSLFLSSILFQNNFVKGCGMLQSNLYLTATLGE